MRPLSCAALFLLGVGCQSGTDPRPRPTIEEARAALPGSIQPNAEVPAPDAKPVDQPGESPSQPPIQDPTQASGPRVVAPVVARVAGHDIEASDLVASWMFRDSEAVREVMDRLVLDALVQAEAARLGVVLDGELVQNDWRETLEEFDAEVAKAAPGSSREDFIQSRLGLSSEHYLSDLARRRQTDLLASRCVRAFTMENDTLEARLIVAPDRETADRVEASLAQGRPFAELASEYSIDPSADEGGRIPPVVRSVAAISRLAFATPVGEVGGPLVERGRFLYLLPEAHHKGVGGGWSQLGPAVEASLETKPIEDLEFVQWQAAVLNQYEVDTTPLLEFVGQPVGTRATPVR